MRFLFDGFRLTIGTKSLRGYVWRPLVTALLAATAAVLLTAVLAATVLSPWLAARFNWDPTWGRWALAALGMVASVFLFSPAFFTVAVLASALKWEGLSREVEEMRFPAPTPDHRLSFRQALFDSWRRMPFGIVAGLISMVLSFFGLFWLGALLVAFFATFDVTGPAFARRRVLFPGQVGPTLKCPGYFTFWLGCWALTLVPIVNILALPAMVAGGTLMVAEAERKRRSNPVPS